MSQKSLSKWLKAIIGGMGICGAFIYLYIIPILGRDLVDARPEYTSWYFPWLAVALVSAIPCYWGLYFGWKISNEIGKDNSFSMENAEYLKNISILAALDSLYFFVANVVFMVIDMNHPGVFLISLIVVFIGVAVTVAAAALSHLVRKAAEIQQENELTI
ncbi:DUF2975 domain-containing protein [Roseburia sp. MSJ-14]|uniref:DUF2975 domain-containing protein n=1 Tax=Roseburia sp. MSJ-14 TaxID=2841514 RepID=UPI001C1153F9|nr:DUF2975 domain-containing protein [Roseburia sp. MSJ-14]MBU5474345.1 DUF2975 domain-containing protein [Roseburia sp. MSJ-14]